MKNRPPDKRQKKPFST